MIEYRVGDATAPPERPAVIAHVCNDVGAWAAGFVLAISRLSPEPERVYRATRPHLGEVQFVHVAPGLTVANMVAQSGTQGRDILRPLHDRALRTCLKMVAARAALAGETVVMPRIGCGLAGGAWEEVGPLVEQTMAGVPVVVYDLP